MDSRSASNASSSVMETSSRSRSAKSRSHSKNNKVASGSKASGTRASDDRPKSRHMSPRRGPYSPHQQRGSGHGNYKGGRYRMEYSPPQRRYDRGSPYRRRDHSYDMYRRGFQNSVDRPHRKESPYNRRRRYDSPYDRRGPVDRDRRNSRSRRQRSESPALSKYESSNDSKDRDHSGSRKQQMKGDQVSSKQCKTFSAEKVDRRREPAERSSESRHRSSSPPNNQSSPELPAKKRSISPSGHGRGRKSPDRRHQEVKRHRGSSAHSSASSVHSRRSESRHRSSKKHCRKTEDRPVSERKRHYSKSVSSSRKQSSQGRYSSVDKDMRKLEQVCTELNDIKNLHSTSERRGAIQSFMKKYTDSNTFAYETPDAARHSPESYEKAMAQSQPVRVTRAIHIPGPDRSCFAFETEWFSIKKTSLITLYVWTEGRLSRVYEFQDVSDLGVQQRQVSLQTILNTKVWVVCRRYLLKKGVQPNTKCTFTDYTTKQKHQETFLL